MCAVGQGSLPELSGGGQTGVSLGEGSARAQTAGGCAGARAGVWWAPETAVTQTAGLGLSLLLGLPQGGCSCVGAFFLGGPKAPVAPGTLAVSLRRLEAAR